MLCFNTRFTFLWRCSFIGKMEVIFFFSSDFFITMLSSWWLKNSSWGCVICASVSPLVLLLLGKCLGMGRRNKVFFLRITPYFKAGKYCAVKYHLDEHLQKDFHQRPLAENALGWGIGHILSFFFFLLLTKRVNQPLEKTKGYDGFLLTRPFSWRWTALPGQVFGANT